MERTYTSTNTLEQSSAQLVQLELKEQMSSMMAYPKKIDMRYDGSILTRATPSYQTVVDSAAEAFVRLIRRWTNVVVAAPKGAHIVFYPWRRLQIPGRGVAINVPIKVDTKERMI